MCRHIGLEGTPEARNAVAAKLFGTTVPTANVITAADRPAVVQYYLDCDLRVFEPQCWKSHKDAGEAVPLDWPHTLAAIYRVRCNLFHGEKSAHSEMDREIVRTAFVVPVLFFRHAHIL